MWKAAEVQAGKQEPLFSPGLILIGSGMLSWQASRPQPPPATRAWWTANSGNNPTFNWKESSRPWKICWDSRDFSFIFFFLLFASKNVHRHHRFRSFFAPCAHAGWNLLKHQVNVFKLREAPCLYSLKQYWWLFLNNSVTWLNKSSHLLCSWNAAHCAVYTYLWGFYRFCSVKIKIALHFETELTSTYCLALLFFSIPLENTYFSVGALIWHLTNCSRFCGWMSLSMRSASRNHIVPSSPESWDSSCIRLKVSTLAVVVLFFLAKLCDLTL